MMSRGDGGNPRQERKRKSGGKKKQGSSGTGSPAGWKANQQKPAHRALAGVDPALLHDLRRWSASKTFKHQFQVAAARPPAAQAPPPNGSVSYQPLRVSKSPPPGLAAVKYAQQQRYARGAALAELAQREKQRSGPARRGNSGPSSLGELYVRYKAEGRIAEFFALFPQ
jgi:hypothetical protein